MSPRDPTERAVAEPGTPAATPRPGCRVLLIAAIAALAVAVGSELLSRNAGRYESETPLEQRDPIEFFYALFPSMIRLDLVDTHPHLRGVEHLPGEAPEQATNYLVFVIDCWREDFSPPHLGAAETMPFLHGLHADGVLRFYDHAYAPAPWTMPSVATMNTGVYVYRHGMGVHDFLSPFSPFYVNEEASGLSFAAMLAKERGYRTAYLSSNGLALKTTGDFETQRELGVIDARGMPLVDAFSELLAEDPDRPFAAVLHTNVAHSPRGGAPNDGRFGDLEAISARTGVSMRDLASFGQTVMDPEQLAIHVNLANHYTHTRDEHYEDIVEAVEISYRWALFEADRMLAGVFDALASAGVADRTMVFVTADHGEDLYVGRDGADLQRFHQEHFLLNTPGVHHGHDVSDEISRVPLFLYHPSVEGGRDSRLASGADIAATILAHAGFEADGIDGRSLLAEPRAPGEPVLTEGAHGALRKLGISKKMPDGTVRRLLLSPYEPSQRQLDDIYHHRETHWIYPSPSERACFVEVDGRATHCEPADVQEALDDLLDHHPHHPFVRPLRQILELPEAEREKLQEAAICDANGAATYCEDYVKRAFAEP